MTVSDRKGNIAKTVFAAKLSVIHKIAVPRKAKITVFNAVNMKISKENISVSKCMAL